MAVADASLATLQNLDQDSAYYRQEFGHINIRERALKEAAQSVGMQAGLHYESEVIDNVLEANSEALNQIYRFNSLMIRDHVMPPVIEQASNALQINKDGQQIRIGGKTYTIVRQIRFVTVPPTWRDYLSMSYPEPEMPAKVLLPKDHKERLLWKVNVIEGWQKGVEQAVDMYHTNLNRLVRDFTGMVLYRKLLSVNMISPSAVKKTAQGISGDAEHMVIDDQTWNIIAKPQLQVHGKLWQPVFVHPQKTHVVDVTANPQSVLGLIGTPDDYVSSAPVVPGEQDHAR